MKKRIILFSSLVVLLMGVVLFRENLLRRMALLVRIDEACLPAEALFVLSGDGYHRVPHAVSLYYQGLAPEIWLSHADEPPEFKLTRELGYQIPAISDQALELLIKQGVPREKILFINEGEVTSTWEEMGALKEYIRVHPVPSVIVVTSAHHTARAHWAWKQVFAKEGSPQEPDVCIVAAADGRFSENNWWKVEKGFLTYFEEYVKWLYYLINY